MDEQGLAAWSVAQKYAKTTTQTRLSDLRKLEKSYGDLDKLYDEDRFESLLKELSYTASDKAAGRPVPSRLKLWGDPYRDLAHLRATLNFYRRFRSGDVRKPPPVLPSRDAVEATLAEYRDLGPIAFADSYGQGWPGARLYVLEGDLAYPSRMIVAAACQYMPAGVPAEDVELPEAVAHAHLQSLGFNGEERPPVLLFGVDGQRYAPVQQTNRTTGRIAYTYRPEGAGNRREEAVEVEAPLGIARALLIDNRPVRIAPIGQSPANYLTYPGSKFSGRWLRPDIEAALGLAPNATETPPTPQAAAAANAEEIVAMTANPTNLILYGPPGTGKTWTTAQEAVALCDGSAPQERSALMERYRDLVAAKRIAFVTFHQSMDYETFVEGLRPETDASETGGAGFSLVPKAGVFREICSLANEARTRPQAADADGFDLTGRKFWKMSLGASGVEDDVYQAALDGGYIVMGWGGDVDWSPSRFDDSNEIRKEWLAAPRNNEAQSNYSQLAPFRNDLKVGDIVIVPYGNRAFRAVGEVVGDYAYTPTPDGDYCHRRAVKWLLKLDDPLPLDTIVMGDFTMRTLYPIADRRVNHAALSRLIGGGATAVSASEGRPDQFVLIIDEINRANVSKVLGELITLIEPDKRLGQPNALTVTLPHSPKPFGVPDNLHIIGTMNTADRSIALLDTALRRRFQFKEMPPRPETLREAQEATGLPLEAALTAINDRIEYLLDREHRIGHAFLVNCRTKVAVNAAFRDKIIPLLQEYFFEDWSRVAAVLNEPKATAKSEGQGHFLSWRRLSDPTGAGGQARLSWEVLPRFDDDAVVQLVQSSLVEADQIELVEAEDQGGVYA